MINLDLERAMRGLRSRSAGQTIEHGRPKISKGKRQVVRGQGYDLFKRKELVNRQTPRRGTFTRLKKSLDKNKPEIIPIATEVRGEQASAGKKTRREESDEQAEERVIGEEQW
ncbi:unnamed protein product [Callosobruchus maculatus]|uniref:Uncharacterized protein n=1 Tax=Callosobruchus maculatus TaxID=64391 RepID=A0A653BZS0_CALMS|nr:unnamed protein product [Callosobruchus maculatus]